MSPKVTEAYKKERRAAIMETALACFAEKGYVLATLDEIARRLGMSKGSVYLYFSSKDEIYKALMKERTETMVEELTGRFAHTADSADGSAEASAVDKLRMVFADFRRQELDELHRLLAFHLDFWLESTRREELKRVMDRQTETAITFIRRIVDDGKAEGCFRPDADAGVAASLFWAARDGIALQFLSGGDPEDYRKLMTEMETMIFRYLH
ncbi:TetR/AcrR family transcriptional regulator [Gorillibacterium massiliense]|uniref:TetR/AcrR family transcriptional regulator n=1 Tax=Gorillibacterium massiliense TaxID=1280390 RepID=UPI0004AD688C|nr:TetR/AcrR family transcriptional regulator [Gorillibacterium massiliense]